MNNDNVYPLFIYKVLKVLRLNSLFMKGFFYV